MPITVLCPGCNARFTVSEKFAGKKGPCPKCKHVITIPAVQEEVKVHVPEDFKGAGKDLKGRQILKPIARQETRFEPRAVAAGTAGALVVLLIAWLARGLESKAPLVFLGLLIVSPPLSVAAYSFLRNADELEPYSGRTLWLRAAICGLVYAVLWGIYASLPPGLVGEAWQWLFAAPLFVGLGATAAWACLDLDFGSGSLHYSFYLLVTLLLRGVIGLPPVWTSGT